MPFCCFILLSSCFDLMRFCINLTKESIKKMLQRKLLIKPYFNKLLQGLSELK